MFDLTPEWTLNVWKHTQHKSEVEIHTYALDQSAPVDLNAILHSLLEDELVERVSIFVRVGQRHADLGTISRQTLERWSAKT